MWQPIKTAPKIDRERVDVWVHSLNAKPEHFRVADAFWCADNVRKSFAGGFWATQRNDKNFEIFDPVENHHTRITHWMPKPDGPSE